MFLLCHFRRVTRSASTPKKDVVIQFKGKDLRLELRAKHEKGKRGRKGKGAVSKEPDVIKFDEENDDDKEGDEVRCSISELLHKLDSDSEEEGETSSGKRPADSEYDVCPKRVKVDIHKLDDPSPCKNAVDGSVPLSGEKRITNTEENVEEVNLRKINSEDDHDKREKIDDDEMKQNETETDGQSGEGENETEESTEDKAIEDSKIDSNANDTEKEGEEEGSIEAGSSEVKEQNTEESTEDKVIKDSKMDSNADTQIDEVTDQNKEAEKEDKQKETGTNVMTDQNKEPEKEDKQKETDTNVKTDQNKEAEKEDTQKETGTNVTDELEMVLEPSSEISRQGGDSVQEIASDEEVQPKRKKVRNN